MVERFYGRISDLVKQTSFASAANLDATLYQYMTAYNHRIPPRALNLQSPIQALKRWQIDKPELFGKRVYKQAAMTTMPLPHLCVHSMPIGNDGPCWWPHQSRSTLGKPVTRRSKLRKR